MEFLLQNTTQLTTHKHYTNQQTHEHGCKKHRTGTRKYKLLAVYKKEKNEENSPYSTLNNIRN